MDVKFLSGTREEYTSLSPKAEGTFYYISDEKRLYLGEKELTTEAEVTAALAQVTTNKNEITNLKKEISALIGSEDGKSIHDLIKEDVGDKTTLTTDAQTTIVEAINEVDKNADDAQKAADEAKAAAETAKTESTVTIEKTTPDGVAARYVIKQNDVEIANGTIDIPKDMVVKSGEVVDVTAEDIAPDGKYYNKVTETGKYIVLTISNATEDQLFIKVDSLVDIYKAATDEAKTKEVKVAIDSSAREISATLTDGGVTESKLADGAVTSGKIAANAVTSNNIAAGAVTEGKIAENAVAEGNIKDGSIAITKLNEELQNKITNTTEATIDDDEKTAGVWNDETGGQLFFLNKSNNVRANVSVNNGTDGTGVYVQLSATDKDSNRGSRIDLDEHKAYYTTDKTSTEHTAKDEIAVKGDLDAYTKTSELGDLAKTNKEDLISELNLDQYAKADTALTAEDIKEGSTEGAISVKGADVQVNGLQELAYKTEEDLGLGDLAKEDKTTFVEELDAKYDKANSASTALESAKAYTDEKLTWGTIAAE